MSGLFLFLEMQSFLEDVVEDIWGKHPHLENLVFVLPSKRAGSFLRNHFAASTKKNIFAPEILSIESFVEKISGLTKANNTQLLFELYQTYSTTAVGAAESFHDFSKWGQTILQDFNEIDRYLITSDQLFSYLTDIQELNHWYLKSEKTPMMQNYIRFWKQLPQLYETFADRLIQLGVGYQGLLYRMACANLEGYQKSRQNKIHIFIGFNALNSAEAYIIQEILSDSSNDIYWDIDEAFLSDPIHDAGYFIRQYLKRWDFLKGRPLQGKSAYYSSDKKIHIAGIPKNVSQAKYVGDLLKTLEASSTQNLKNTAVILGDESLLNPLLNSVPSGVSSVNITMGFPLFKTPLAGMFTQFFELYLNEDSMGVYFKSFFSFLSNNYVQLILSTADSRALMAMTDEIKKQNWTYINTEKLKRLSNQFEVPVASLFLSQKPKPEAFIDRCLELINLLRKRLETKTTGTGLAHLYQLYTLFNQLKTIIHDHSFIDDLKSLYALFKELITLETIDFQGEPMEGLQIMGMLESRNLDFETVIITSVNEGILPSGKANNSFIPFDVKKEFNLPTYKEKDAVYTYHFYRLLQRARNIYIVYNTEADVLEGGEKSRFISQLMTAGTPRHDITHFLATPVINNAIAEQQFIVKNSLLMDQLKQLASRGLSPTSLTNYIRNPIDFYKKSILGIEDPLAVEAAIAANTFGTIIHDTLEELYTPFIGTILSADKLAALKPTVLSIVERQFKNSYSISETLSGKNLIALHVICRYIHNFLNLEIAAAGKHRIRILGLEEKLSVQLDIPALDYPVKLKGKLDRIDEFDGVLRIIDYKTGQTKKSDVEIINWEDLRSGYDSSKAFQLLCYALMYCHNAPVANLIAGIISFKNLRDGLFTFGTKETKGSRKKNPEIDPETLKLFKEQLQLLLLEIYNPEIPFTEKII